MNTVIATSATLTTSSFINTFPGWTSSNEPPAKHLFYITQTINKFISGNLTFSGCTSLPSVDTVNIYPNPPAPSFIQPVDYCSGVEVDAFTVSGVSSSVGFNWYLTSITTNEIGNSNTLKRDFPLTSGSSVTHTTYVNQSFNGCKSLLASIAFKINPLPIVDLNTVGDKYKFCNNELNTTITAFPSGGTFITTMPGFSVTGANTAYLTPKIPENIL